MKSFCVIAALFSGAAGTSTSTSAYAQRWLASHPAVQQDQLAELKDVNPDAYAIVKALLTKRSLGLLDPKHPTASFVPAAPKADEGAPSGASAFALSAEDEAVASKKKGGDDSDSAAVYPEAVPVHAHHGDWMNWKPSDSAMDDDAMVKSVLGEVGSLVGKKGASQPVATGSSSALSQDEASFAADFPTAMKTAAPAAPAQEAPATAAAPQGNTYLRGLSGGDDAVQKAAAPAGGSLASFSWSDDNAASATTEAPAATAAAPKKKTALSAFDSWLGGGSSPHVQAAAPSAQAVQTTTGNPYTAGLW